MEMLQARREWQEIFQVMKTKGLQPRLLYPARLSIKMEGQIRTFPDKRSLKDYTSSKPEIFFCFIQYAWAIPRKIFWFKEYMKPLSGSSVGWSIVPYTKKVVHSISCWCTYPGWRFNPQSGHVQEATNSCFSHWCFSLSLPLLSLLPSFPLSLISITYPHVKIIFKEKYIHTLLYCALLYCTSHALHFY